MEPRAASHTSAAPATHPNGQRRRTILMVAYHFAPDNASGTHRSIHFARSLHEAGYEVHVLTVPVDHAATVDYALNAVFPYDDRIVRVPKRQTTGELYRRLKRRLVHQSDPSERRNDNSSADPAASMPGPLSAVVQPLRRHFAGFDAFPDEHRGWYRPALAAGLRLSRQTGFDGVFASGPPWTGVLAAARLARKLDSALLVDFRDPWTENTGRGARYKSDWSHWLAKRCERSVLRQAKLALFNSPAIERAAQDAYPQVERRCFRTILNGSDAPRRESERPVPYPAQLRIRHFGTLYRGRSVLPLIQSLQRLLERGLIAPGEVGVELIGRCSADNESLAAQPIDGIPVYLKRRLPYGEAIAQMAEPSVLLVAQPGHLNFQIPTKLYDYLCSGNPVAVMTTEESATWSVARGFSRCNRLEPAESEHNVRVVGEMIERWRDGRLLQEASASDTLPLSKKVLGHEFVQAVTEALSR